MSMTILPHKPLATGKFKCDRQMTRIYENRGVQSDK